MIITGFEYQPTVRGEWAPDDDTSYWSAITRAVRVPDRVGTDGILDFGPFAVAIGNMDKESILSYTYETGYRKRLEKNLVLDGTVYYSDYQNTIQGTSQSGIDFLYGFEGVAKYQFNPRLRMELSYAYNEGEKRLVDDANLPVVRLPKHSINLRSYYNLTSSMDFDVMIYFVDETQGNSASLIIPAYTRLDLRYGWRTTKQLELSLLLTNLLDETHPEAIDAFKISTAVERGDMLKITYTK